MTILSTNLDNVIMLNEDCLLHLHKSMDGVSIQKYMSCVMDGKPEKKKTKLPEKSLVKSSPFEQKKCVPRSRTAALSSEVSVAIGDGKRRVANNCIELLLTKKTRIAKRMDAFESTKQVHDEQSSSSAINTSCNLQSEEITKSCGFVAKRRMDPTAWDTVPDSQSQHDDNNDAVRDFQRNAELKYDEVTLLNVFEDLKITPVSSCSSSNPFKVSLIGTIGDWKPDGLNKIACSNLIRKVVIRNELLNSLHDWTKDKEFRKFYWHAKQKFPLEANPKEKEDILLFRETFHSDKFHNFLKMFPLLLSEPGSYQNIGAVYDFDVPGLEHILKNSDNRYIHAIYYMYELVVEAPNTLPGRFIPLLGSTRQFTMTLLQTSTIIALAFFDLLISSRLKFTRILKNFTKLHQQKIYFILEYFRHCARQQQLFPSKRFQPITFVLTECEELFEKLEEYKLKMTNATVYIDKNGKIESYTNCAHIDFANKCIGGGVLGDGSVQEEIMFLCRPDALVSMLICRELKGREALHIIGAPSYSNYANYGAELQCVMKDDAEFDEAFKDNSFAHEIIAIDAFDLRNCKSSVAMQFEEKYILREIRKCCAGFADGKQVIATGNWGCGIFCGDPLLKSIIQWIAAALCSRSLVYCSFGNFDTTCKLDIIINYAYKYNFTVGNMYSLLKRYGVLKPKMDFFVFFLSELNVASEYKM